MKRDKGSNQPKAAAPDESEFKIGSLVGVYIEGTRYGKILELEIDDAGDLVAHIDLKYKSRKKLWFKTKELTLEG